MAAVLLLAMGRHAGEPASCQGAGHPAFYEDGDFEHEHGQQRLGTVEHAFPRGEGQRQEPAASGGYLERGENDKR